MKAEYAAGFFDGEGCVMVAKDGRPRSGKSPVYTLQVNIANTDPRPLMELQALFGGDLRTSTRPGHQPVHYWRLSARKAQAFLEWIQPYSVIKRQQIDTALEFQASKGLPGGRGRAVSAEDLAVRDGFYRRLQQMKRPLVVPA